MYNLELTEEQAEVLINLIVEHAEWADVLDSEDRKLITILDAMEYQMMPLYEGVIAEKLEQRQINIEMAKESRKENESN